jgi:ankyrin repeat protein
LQSPFFYDIKPNAEYVTPLNVAVKDGNLNIIKCPMLKGFPGNEQEDTTTPLMGAVEEGNVEVLQQLLKFGAKVNH